MRWGISRVAGYFLFVCTCVWNIFLFGFCVLLRVSFSVLLRRVE